VITLSLAKSHCVQLGLCKNSTNFVVCILEQMATSTTQHVLSSIKLLPIGCFHPDKRNSCVLSVSVGRRCPSARNLGLVCASNTQSSVIEPVQLPGSPKSGVTPKKSGTFLSSAPLSSGHKIVLRNTDSLTL